MFDCFRRVKIPFQVNKEISFKRFPFFVKERTNECAGDLFLRNKKEKKMHYSKGILYSEKCTQRRELPDLSSRNFLITTCDRFSIKDTAF